MAVISCCSQNVIVSSCRIVDKYTYKEMGIAIFGKTGGMIISIIMLCYTILSCTSYFVIIGDMVTKVTMFFFPTVSILQKRYIVVPVICILFIFPLCMMRSVFSLLSSFVAVDSLKYVSIFSVLAVDCRSCCNRSTVQSSITTLRDRGSSEVVNRNRP